jgi:outer membrane immunogenic protein
MLKRWLGSAGVMILLVAGPAVAADMPLKAPPMAPAIADWSGAYVGVNGGWGRADTTWTFPEVVFFNTAAGQSFAVNPTAAVVGGHAGYNMENNSFVFGVEFAADWTNLNQTVVGPVPAFRFDTYTTKITDVETLTARIGYAPGNWLFYVKGGVASANIQLAGISGAPVPNVAFSDTERMSGLAVGGGIETLWAGHFVFGVEYLYMDFADSVNVPAFCTVVATCGTAVQHVDLSTNDLRIQTLLGRLSYKF